jgi:nucleoside-diphosphate-sugar epimerase
MKFTIIGGSGFIGTALVSRLSAEGYNVFLPKRGDNRLYQGDLGHVIYAAGVTADFRTRPFDTMRAHVHFLANVLERASFKSLLYLSSARIYRHVDEAQEEIAVPLRSEDQEDYYDLTKLAGEALCHASGRDNVRVARLSNVIGLDFLSDNFISTLIRSALNRGSIELRSSLDSEKDYVMIDDVVDVLPLIAMQGRHRCYNVAGGINVTHARIVASIAKATGAGYSVALGAPRILSPPINIRRVQAEFGFAPHEFLSKIPLIVSEFRKRSHAEGRL